MYICLCNALTEAEVKQVVVDGAQRPRELYTACGCRAQCGACTRMILSLLQTPVSEPELSAGLVAGGD